MPFGRVHSDSPPAGFPIPYLLFCRQIHLSLLSLFSHAFHFYVLVVTWTSAASLLLASGFSSINGCVLQKHIEIGQTQPSFMEEQTFLNHWSIKGKASQLTFFFFLNKQLAMYQYNSLAGFYLSLFFFHAKNFVVKMCQSPMQLREPF